MLAVGRSDGTGGGQTHLLDDDFWESFWLGILKVGEERASWEK